MSDQRSTVKKIQYGIMLVCKAIFIAIVFIAAFGAFCMLASRYYTPLPTKQIATVKAPTKTHNIVTNSARDGSVLQVKRYLQTNLKDPDSFQAIEWGVVQKNEQGIDLPYKFVVRCKYRAKNSFGGYIVNHQVFYLSGNGTVLAVSDLNL